MTDHKRPTWINQNAEETETRTSDDDRFLLEQPTDDGKPQWNSAQLYSKHFVRLIQIADQAAINKNYEVYYETLVQLSVALTFYFEKEQSNQIEILEKKIREQLNGYRKMIAYVQQNSGVVSVSDDMHNARFELVDCLRELDRLIRRVMSEKDLLIPQVKHDNVGAAL